MVDGGGELAGYDGSQKTSKDPGSAEILVFAGFQAHLKTSLDVFFDHLVGRGNLNWLVNTLINKGNLGFCFKLECRLEYCEKYFGLIDGQIGRQLPGDPCSTHSH